VPDIPVEELAWAAHATPLSVGTGLRPADGSSVAPMRSPVGGTGVPPVMPGGEVVPIPGNVLPICATADPQPNTSIKATNAGRILSCMVGRKRSARRRGRSARATHRVRCSEGQADAMIIEFELSTIGAAAQVVFRT
jgi:hypothetical protein